LPSAVFFTEWVQFL
jgi:hypothetical protein